jgi:hypothetical protein
LVLFAFSSKTASNCNSLMPFFAFCPIHVGIAQFIDIENNTIDFRYFFHYLAQVSEISLNAKAVMFYANSVKKTEAR